MNLEDALKWADTFGPIQSNPPTGDGPALLVLAAEVRRLQARLATIKFMAETADFKETGNK